MAAMPPATSKIVPFNFGNAPTGLLLVSVLHIKNHPPNTGRVWPENPDLDHNSRIVGNPEVMARAIYFRCVLTTSG